MMVSEKVRKIHAPTPLDLEKSGIPSNVNVLNRVAAKVINPISTPILVPPNIKSEEVFICFFVLHEKKNKMPM